MREYAGIVRAILRGEDPPQGEKFQCQLPLPGLRAAPRHPDLPGRPLPRHAAAGGRDRRRRGALAVHPGVHPRRGRADRGRGPRQGRQAGGGLRHRGGGPVRGHGRHRAGQGAAARGADPVLLAALLPQDARGLRVRRRPRRLRRARARTPSPTASSSRSPRSGARRRPRPRCAATPTAARPRPPSAASPGRTSTPRSRPSPARSAEPNERSGTCAFTFAPRWGVSPRDEEGSSGHRGLPRGDGPVRPHGKRGQRLLVRERLLRAARRGHGPLRRARLTRLRGLRHLGRRRHAVPHAGDRARALPALRPRRPHARRLGAQHGRPDRDARPERRLEADRRGLDRAASPASARAAPRRRRARAGRPGHGGALEPPGDPGLRELPGGRAERERHPVQGLEPDRAGARLPRRPHPPRRLRVPRRPLPLRAAVEPVRGHDRAQGLRRPLPQRRRRGDGELLLDGLAGRHAQPRGLAQLRRLAARRVAEPRGHLLEVDRARLALGAADHGQRPGREPRAVRALPAQGADPQLQRDGQRVQAARRHVRAPGLHRRPVRRSRQGLLPDRQVTGARRVA